MQRLYLLYESSVGLSLFSSSSLDNTAISSTPFQKIMLDFSKFSQNVKLVSFSPFPSSDVALDTLNKITEGSMSDFLGDFISSIYVSESSKHKTGTILGVSDPKLAGTLSTEMQLSCLADSNVREIIRGIRLHFVEFLGSISNDDVKMAQLGLSHGYSRAKVKFNQHGDDNMVISSSVLLTTLDKDLNTFAMRLRDWYCVIFPELSPLIADHAMFARTVRTIGRIFDVNRENLMDLLKDDRLVDNILIAIDNTIGREIGEKDYATVLELSSRVIGIAEYRDELQGYLRKRMHNIAPNLTNLVGERMGALLIAAAGSLTNLAKAPASTVQLLGSEKALFNALKKRKPTPKYGHIYNSGPVIAAEPSMKGRVARSLATKISVAARLDAFGDDLRSGHFGVLLRDLLDTRFEKNKKGAKIVPNLEAMLEAIAKARELEVSHPDVENAGNQKSDETPKEEEKKKKRKNKSDVTEATTTIVEEVKPIVVENPKPADEEPKKKRRKHKEPEAEIPPAEIIPEPTPIPVAEPPVEDETPKRRKKHRKSE